MSVSSMLFKHSWKTELKQSVLLGSLEYIYKNELHKHVTDWSKGMSISLGLPTQKGYTVTKQMCNNVLSAENFICVVYLSSRQSIGFGIICVYIQFCVEF